MRYELRILPSAESDLEDLFDYISRQSSRTRAVAYVQQLQDACLVLEEHPYIGRAREDLSVGLRSIAIAGRAVIVYRAVESVVEVVHIFYAGRDYGTEDFKQ
jgi:toxin ParE1/3/4